MTGFNRRGALDWSFRILIVALALLWVAYPPQGAPASEAEKTVTR
jgi:hypothetical protein